MKSRNLPGFSGDHGIIKDSRNFHGFRNYGKFHKFGNIHRIVDKTQINPCIVRMNDGNFKDKYSLLYRTHPQSLLVL